MPQNKKTQQFIKRYRNLSRLCESICGGESEYQKDMYAKGFVSTMYTLIKQPNLRAQLGDKEIDRIYELAVNVRRSQFIDNADKRVLIGLINDLKTIKYELGCQSKTV